MPLAPQLVWFEQVGKRYEPDLVIQFVYGSMAITDVSEPLYSVDDKGYLVPLNADVGWRWREMSKKFATVFHGWLLWTKLNVAQSPVQLGGRGAVLGAGREMAAWRNFDLTHQKCAKQCMCPITFRGFYALWTLGFSWSTCHSATRSTGRTKAAGGTSEYEISLGRQLSTPSSFTN
jgi:hypothetical protein